MKPYLDNDLSPLSKVWIYQSSRLFSSDEVDALRQHVKDFASRWTAHGEPVKADGEVLYDRFIVLMADERSFVSGCSIDASVNFIRSLGKEYDTNFFDRWLIAYLKDGEVQQCGKQDLDKLLNTGEIDDETIVFNNLVQTKKDFEEKWQMPYGESWLKALRGTHTPFTSVL
jgi:hypothetical protein